MARLNYKDVTVFASAARTASASSSDIRNIERHRGIILEIDCTAVTATPSVVFTIQGKIGANYYTMLASAAITAVGKTYLRVFPGATAAANTVANDCVPEVWRVDAVNADADSITYSVKAHLIP